MSLFSIARRREITNEWMFVLAGLLSIALGLLLVIRPGEGALALATWIGIFGIAWGVALCILAFRGSQPGLRGSAFSGAGSSSDWTYCCGDLAHRYRLLGESEAQSAKPLVVGVPLSTANVVNGIPSSTSASSKGLVAG